MRKVKGFASFLQERYDLWKFRSMTAGKITSPEDIVKFETAKDIFAEIEEIYNAYFPEINISVIEKKFGQKVVNAEPKADRAVIEQFKLGELVDESTALNGSPSK